MNKGILPTKQTGGGEACRANALGSLFQKERHTPSATQIEEGAHLVEQLEQAVDGVAAAWQDLHQLLASARRGAAACTRSAAWPPSVDA